VQVKLVAELSEAPHEAPFDCLAIRRVTVVDAPFLVGRLAHHPVRDDDEDRMSDGYEHLLRPRCAVIRLYKTPREVCWVCAAPCAASIKT
jgi:hypothetical protein